MLSKFVRAALFFFVVAAMPYGYSAAKAQLRDASDVPLLAQCNNIALGKPTNASSNGVESGLAVDSDLGTLWNALTYAPQWIELDLGSPQTVDAIRLYVAQTPEGNTTHEIWVAGSSKVYTKVETISGFTTNGQLLERVYSPALTSVQWIRINTTVSPSWVAWWDIQVCQTPSPINTPTRTPTNTPQNTPSSTPTHTPTPLPTNTPTRTPTSTSTSGPTNTPTSTSIVGPVNTPTHTPTNTPANGPTNAPTNTPISTLTFTPTSMPSSTPISNMPGKITGGGQIGPENRPAKATFGLTVQYDQGQPTPKGNLNYVDHETGMHLSSTTLELLVIQGTTAWFTGMATVNDGQEVWFKVEVRDLNKLGSTDWFMISIPDLNGYEAGGMMTGGNITIH